MARPAQILTLLIRGDTKGAVAELKKLGTQAKSAGSKLSSGFEAAKRSIFSLKGAIATLGVAALFRSIVRATSEQERVLAQLDAVLKSTGGAAGIAKEEVVSFAAELQKVTTYGDEAIVDLQNKLLTFTNIQGDAFKRATEIVLDMSTALGQDLKQSAIQVGKALQDPVLGATALREVGVNVNETMQKQIKLMVKAGDVAGAQALILRELESEYGNSARAARQTFGGALESLKNALGDLIEGKGEGLEGARESIERLTERLQSPETVAAFNDLVTLLAKTAGFAADAAVAIDAVFTNVSPFALERQIQDTLDAIDELESRRRGTSFAKGRVGAQEYATELQRLNKQLDDLKKKQREALELSPPSSGTKKPPEKKPSPTLTPLDDEAEKRQQQIADMIKSLQEEADTHGKTAQQVALYRLEQLKAGDADLDRARALVELIDRQEAADKEAEARAKKQAEDQRLAEKQQQALRDFAESVKDSLDPTRELRREYDELEKAWRAGLITLPELANAQAKVNEEIRNAGKDTEDAISVFRDQAKRNTQDILASGLETALTDGVKRGAQGALEAFRDMIVKMIIEAEAAKIADKLFGKDGQGKGNGQDGGQGQGQQPGGFLVQLFSALFAHKGAEAGDPNAPRVLTPAEVFNGAPRFHAGSAERLKLMSHEVPAILRDDEIVLSPEESRDYRRGGRNVYNVNVSTPTPQNFSQNESRIAAGFASLMLRARNRNGNR